jgi:hypothetical protein
MAKRFTDSEKWNKASFHKWSPKAKFLWLYLCDRCDHAGLWDPNFELLEFHLGFTTNAEEISNLFGERVMWTQSGKLYLTTFFEFQYGQFDKAKSKCALSAFSRLEKEGLFKPLPNPSLRVKDTDTDTDTDLDKDTDKDARKIFVAELRGKISKIKGL